MVKQCMLGQYSWTWPRVAFRKERGKIIAPPADFEKPEYIVSMTEDRHFLKIYRKQTDQAPKQLSDKSVWSPIPQSHTAEQPTAPCRRATEQ